MEKDKLALGCGQNFHGDDWVHLDKSSLGHVDVVCDLKNGSLPFEDDSFNRVRAAHILEHLPPHALIELLEEINRVTKEGGVFKVVMPHFLSWNAADLDHYRAGSRRTFAQFCENYTMNSPYPTLFHEKSIEYRFERYWIYRYLRKITSDEKIAQLVPNAVKEIVYTFEVI